MHIRYYFMNLLPDEEEIAHNGNVLLTNFRLVEEKISTGEKKCKEIPLKNLDSIVTQSSVNVGAIVFGVIIAIISAIITADEEEIGAVGLIIGVIVIILGFLSSTEYVKFNAQTLTIKQEKKGMEEFTECVRTQLYKNPLSDSRNQKRF